MDRTTNKEPTVSTSVLHRTNELEVEPVLGRLRRPPLPTPVVLGAVVVSGLVVSGLVVVVLVVVVDDVVVEATGHTTQVIEADAVWVVKPTEPLV